MPGARAHPFARALLSTLVLASCWGPGGSEPDPMQDALARMYEEWTRPFPAFRIVGNVYWVGSWDLATYLITTPQGHFLINTASARPPTRSKLRSGSSASSSAT